MPAVDGLASGLDTANIIKQLMQLERQPQARLQSKQTSTESAITSLRGLNAKFLTLATAAESLGAPKPGAPPVVPAKPTDWQLATATSSDATRATVQAVPGARPGALSFNVEQLATAASSLSAGTYASPTAAFTSGGLTLTKGGATVAVDTGDGSLAATVAGINKAGAGVTASAVQVKPGEYRLYLSSTTTGADSAVTLADAAGPVGLTEVVPARNAVIVLGGVQVERASNTISDVLEGVTLTLTKADTKTAAGFVEPPVTVSVASDSEGVAAKVAALVEAANAARAEAKTLTSADPVAKTRGRLYGDSGVRSLVDAVRSAVVGPTGDQAVAGVTTARDGTILFDKAVFLKALANDPAATEAALGKDGLAGRLSKVVDNASRAEGSASGAGIIASAVADRERQVTQLKSGILSWDSRLARREATLQRQYTALETALGRAQSQGSFLSQQLANLSRG